VTSIAATTTVSDGGFTAAPDPALLSELAGSFGAAAAAASGLVERSYRIAGYPVTLRGAGTAVIDRLSRTFTHLEAPAHAGQHLVVNLWDSSTHGTPEPPLPSVEGEQAPGAFFYYGDDRVRAGFQLGTSGDVRVLDVYKEEPTRALSVLDSATFDAWYWVDSAARIPYWEEATPIRYLLDWYLRDRGILQVHAGSVGTEAGGVLLVGKSGSGKSTATLSTLQSALQYAGDDYVAVDTEGEPYVHALYSAGKLMPDHVQRLPFLLPALANSEQLETEKAVVYVHEHWPERMTTGFPLRAICVPRVVPGLEQARVVKASALVGMTALAPSTVFQMHTRGKDALGRMGSLLEKVPTYFVEMGSDMPSIPVAILELIAQLNEEAT
jgi:hypothetical protein